MNLFLTTLIYLLVWRIGGALAISVENSSSCAHPQYCGKNHSIPNDVVCKDSEYDSNPKGQRMKSCLLCESTSTVGHSPKNNNVYWFLLNQKLTIQHCLFETGKSTPATAYNACQTNCDPLESVYKTPWTKSRSIKPYDYCTMNSKTFGRYVDGCARCYGEQSDTVIISNFLRNMQSACKTKPNSTKGQTVDLPRGLFDTSHPSSSPKPSSSPNPSHHSGLSTGASVGIGVGVGVGGALLIAAVLAWFFVHRRRKRAQAVVPVEYGQGYINNYAEQQQAQQQHEHLQVQEIQELPLSTPSPAEVEGDEVNHGNSRKDTTSAPVHELQ